MKDFLKSNYGKLALDCVLCVVSGTLSNWIDWCKYIFWGTTISLFVVVVVAIVFAWIINPIRKRFSK